MSDELLGLVRLLAEHDVLDTQIASPSFEALGVIYEPGEPTMWWATSLVKSRWWFNFWLDEIAEAQIDDGLVDVIAPVMAEMGVELTHDWHGGPTRPDPEAGLRLWINDVVCDFGPPPELSCVQPLVVANQLLAQADTSRRFYFCGRQWTDGQYVPESISVALLPIVIAEALVASPNVLEAVQPFLVDEVLTQ